MPALRPTLSSHPLVLPLRLGHAPLGWAPQAVDTEASKGRSGFCGLAEHRCPVRGDPGRRRGHVQRDSRTGHAGRQPTPRPHWTPPGRGREASRRLYVQSCRGAGGGRADPCRQPPRGLGAALRVGGQGPSPASEVHGRPEWLWRWGPCLPLFGARRSPDLDLGVRVPPWGDPQAHPASPLRAPGSLRNWIVNDEVRLDYS